LPKIIITKSGKPPNEVTWHKLISLLLVISKLFEKLLLKRLKVKLSLYRPWRPLGLREVEAPTFLDIRLTDGGKVLSPTRQPLFTPRKIPGTHFC
jgi:hypothetical protein